MGRWSVARSVALSETTLTRGGGVRGFGAKFLFCVSNWPKMWTKIGKAFPCRNRYTVAARMGRTKCGPYGPETSTYTGPGYGQIGRLVSDALMP